MSLPARLDHWLERKELLEYCFQEASPPLKWVFASELCVVDEMIAHYQRRLAAEPARLH